MPQYIAADEKLTFTERLSLMTKAVPLHVLGEYAVKRQAEKDFADAVNKKTEPILDRIKNMKFPMSGLPPVLIKLPK